MDAKQAYLQMAKQEQLHRLREWLKDPVTTYFLALSAEEAHKSENCVFADPPDSIHQFLLREQILGEIRASRWLFAKIDQTIENLAKELTPSNDNDDENPTES